MPHHKPKQGADSHALSTGRSLAMGTRGAVASPHYLASQVGIETLKKGGHPFAGELRELIDMHSAKSPDHFETREATEPLSPGRSIPSSYPPQAGCQTSLSVGPLQAETPRMDLTSIN